LRKVQALKEHGQILEAVSERDADKAERLVKEHLENAIKTLTIEFPQTKEEPSNNL
jgi:DNA-binding FadR family transcriptional regulator